MLDLPNEILIRIFKDEGLTSKDIEEIKMASFRFEEILNDPYFWWKKSVDEGYTTMTLAQFKRKMVTVVVPDMTPTGNSNSICMFRPDHPVNPEELYLDLQFLNTYLPYHLKNDKDDDYLNSMMEYSIQQLNFAVAHGGVKSITSSINMIGSVMERRLLRPNLSDAFILAARRSNVILSMLANTLDHVIDYNDELEKYRNKFLDALKDECLDVLGRDDSTIKNLMGLVIISYGGVGWHNYFALDNIVIIIKKIDPVSPSFNNRISSIAKILLENEVDMESALEQKLYKWGLS